jgi:hypothetical protein
LWASQEALENIMIQRFGLAFVLFGLVLILAVVGLMLTDGLTPGRVQPGFAAIGAALGGVLLVLGLFGLERGRDQTREMG